MKDSAEVIIAINAADIEKNKVRGDLGITYDSDVLRLIDAFRSMELYVGSVVVTQYSGQPAADAFQTRLEQLGIPGVPPLSHRGLSSQHCPYRLGRGIWQEPVYRDQPPSGGGHCPRSGQR